MITKAIDLINPEVLMDTIQGKIDKSIKFAPYAKIDTNLVGTAGTTITRPKYAYIGPAQDLQEGTPVDFTKMSITSTQVTVKEAGTGIGITEQALITNPGDEIAEAEHQLSKAVADKIDIDYLDTMSKTELIFNGDTTVAKDIVDAISLFNDEDDEDYILFIHPKDYTKLRTSLIHGNTFLSMEDMIDLLGLKAIERTKRVEEGISYIQKKDAVEIVYKKRAEIKAGEDIEMREVKLVINTFYATNLYNEGGVIKMEIIE